MHCDFLEIQCKSHSSYILHILYQHNILPSAPSVEEEGKVAMAMNVLLIELETKLREEQAPTRYVDMKLGHLA